MANEYNAHEIQILRNIYRKLDNMPLGFGVPQYSDSIPDENVYNLFHNDLNDALRESRISINDISVDSFDEYQIENRSLYHVLRRYRMSSSIFFKFSTAVDGKTVDKTQIPKMISAIISEYDVEFKKWRGGSASSTWQMDTNVLADTGVNN